MRPLAAPWLSVDRRLRIDFDGTGTPHLLDRARLKRGRITEVFTANSLPVPRNCTAGQEISRLGMVLRAECPDVGPAPVHVTETAAGDLALNWKGARYTLHAH